MLSIHLGTLQYADTKQILLSSCVKVISRQDRTDRNTDLVLRSTKATIFGTTTGILTFRGVSKAIVWEK